MVPRVTKINVCRRWCPLKSRMRPMSIRMIYHDTKQHYVMISNELKKQKSRGKGSKLADHRPFPGEYKQSSRKPRAEPSHHVNVVAGAYKIYLLPSWMPPALWPPILHFTPWLLWKAYLPKTGWSARPKMKAKFSNDTSRWRCIQQTDWRPTFLNGIQLLWDLYRPWQWHINSKQLGVQIYVSG